jgi:hypothetical protein
MLFVSFVLPVFSFDSIQQSLITQICRINNNSENENIKLFLKDRK